LSSEYQTVLSDKAGFAQTKSLEAMNRKHTATHSTEIAWAKIFLPKNNSKGRSGRSKKNRKGGSRGGRGTGANAFPGLSFNVQQPGMAIKAMPLFGQSTRRTLSYVTNFVNITSGAGLAGAYVFSANGCFDPDITGTGGQPMGFDQMMIFYNHYTVLRSRITVVFKATSAVGPVVSVAVSGSSTPLTSIEQIEENGRCVLAWLNPIGVADSHARLNAAVNMARFQGLVFAKDDPDMRGDSASNPAEQVYYLLYVWNPIDSTVVTAGVSVRIEYDVWFHEPRSASLS